MSSLGDLFLRVGADITGFRSAMGTVKNEASSMQGVFQKLGGAANLGFGAIGVGAFAAATKFDSAFAAISNATGKTGKDLDGLSKSFVNVYKQVDESSEQVSEALSLLATRTGLTGSSLEALTIKLLDLGKVQNESVSSLTPVITRAFGDWSIATDKQGSAMDYLGVVSQQTGAKVGRLADQIVYAGAPLRELGYNFESATALIGKFDKEGVNVELVLGGMKAALQQFTKAGVQDSAAEWQKLVAGVRSGTVTFQQLTQLVGAKRGVDLFKAIQEGRFEIEATVQSFRELSKQGLQTTDTLTEQWKKYAHQIEAAVAEHSSLITTIGLTTPAIMKLVDVAKKSFGGISAAVGGTTAAVTLLIGGLSLALSKLGELELRKSNANSTGLAKLNEKYGPRSSGSIMDSALAFTEIAPYIGKDPAAPGAGAGGLDLPGKEKKHHRPDEFVGPMETYFSTPYDVEAIERQTAAAKKLVDTIVTMGETGLVGAMNLRRGWQEQGAGLDSLLLKFMNLQPVLAELATVDMSKTRNGILETDDIMAKLGLTSTRALKAIYDNALKAAQRIAVLRTEGKATDSDLSAAMENVADKHKDLSQRINDWDDKTKKATKTGVDFGRQVSTVFTDLGRSLADVAFGTKRWGDALMDVGRAGLRMIMEDLIGVGFAALKSGLKDLTKHFSGFASALGGLFKGGASVVEGATGAAGSAIQSAAVNAATGGVGAATSIGGGAAKAGSQAASIGLQGITNMVTGAISAVSGVIGNFQFMAMNKSLDLIVNHTLRIFNEVFQQRIDHWEQYNQMYNRLGEVWNTLKGGGGGNVTIDLRNSTFGAGVTKASMTEAFQQMYREAVATAGR